MSDTLFVVGIGASAGGLQPMVELLEHASCHENMCFVIVSHVPRYSEKGSVDSVLTPSQIGHELSLVSWAT